jgi:hypothetical protein
VAVRPTLEFSGRLATRAEIASATNLDDETLDGVLRALTGRGLLISAESSGETTFQPARRDWSRAPDEPLGPGARDGYRLRSIKMTRMMITMSTSVPRPMYMADSLLRGLECPAVPAGTGFIREEVPARLPDRLF